MNNLLGVAPIDFAAGGTELAGYVAGAAGAGLAVFLAIKAVRIVIRAFSSVAK